MISTLISGSGDKTIKIWDMNTGKCVNTLNGHSDLIYSIALTPDGTRIVSGSRDKSVKIWDLQSGLCLKTLYRHSHYVR